MRPAWPRWASGWRARSAGKFAAPDRVVVAIIGDGGFLMNGMEVSTAVHYGKQVIWVVMNDAGYGMIHHAFRMMKRPDIGTRYPSRRLRPGGRGIGSAGVPYPGTRPDQPGADPERSSLSGRPTVLDVEIDPDEVAPFGGRVETLGTNFGG